MGLAVVVFALIIGIVLVGGAFLLGQSVGHGHDSPRTLKEFFTLERNVYLASLVLGLALTGVVIENTLRSIPSPDPGQQVTVLEVYRRLDDNRRVAVIGWFEGAGRDLKGKKYHEDKIFPDKVLAGGPYPNGAGPRLNSLETLVLQADGAYARTVGLQPATAAASNP